MTTRSARPLVRHADVPPSWGWPRGNGKYDASVVLSMDERTALRAVVAETRMWRTRRRVEWRMLDRLVEPLADARATLWAPNERTRRAANNAVAYVLLRCDTSGQSFWGWDAAEWTRACGHGQPEFAAANPRWATDCRPYVIALAHLLGDFTDPLMVGGFPRVPLAEKVFGPEALEVVIKRVVDAGHDLGYRSTDVWCLPCVLCEALLLTRSLDLASVSLPILERIRTATGQTRTKSGQVYRLHRVLASLGLMGAATWRTHPARHESVGEGVGVEWKEWVELWFCTSTLGRSTRLSIRSVLFQVGRWLASEHPAIRTPGDWTRELCAAYFAQVDRWCIGDFAERSASLPKARIGHGLRPNAKANHMFGVRHFFRNCQEWEWIPRRFDPARALDVPRSIKALIGPDPRVIDDKIWAKLIWAGLNVTDADFPAGRRGATTQSSSSVLSPSPGCLLDCEAMRSVVSALVACAGRPRIPAVPTKVPTKLTSPSAFSMCRHTRRAPPSRSPWNRWSAGPSPRGKLFRPDNRRFTIDGQGRPSLRSSPTGATRSATPISMTPSSQPSVAKRVCRSTMLEVGSPATVRGRRSPASCTTPRIR